MTEQTQKEAAVLLGRIVKHCLFYKSETITTTSKKSQWSREENEFKWILHI